MSNTSKNLVAFTATIVAMAVIFGGLGYYIDKNFGDGTSILVGAVLVGVVIATVISTTTTFLNNRTHQSAGDDITAFHRESAKTQTMLWGAQREYARMDRELAGAQAKISVIDHKAMTAKEQHEWKAAQRQAAEESARAKKQDEEVAAAEWWNIDADHQSTVDLE